jgi:Uma2 family endonuclease
MRQPLQGESGYTYEDYLAWDDGRRWEIIDGIAYEKSEGPSIVNDMTPAPGRFHQTIVGNLFREIGVYLKGKPGRIFSSPFDVKLGDQGNESIVQPDLSIFCSSEVLDEKGANGPPDWVIEVLSPYTKSRDLGIKKQLYQKFKVKEYWIVSPEKKSVSVFILKDRNRYSPAIEFQKDANVRSFTFPDLEINLQEIFQL